MNEFRIASGRNTRQPRGRGPCPLVIIDIVIIADILVHGWYLEPATDLRVLAPAALGTDFTVGAARRGWFSSQCEYNIFQ